MKVPISPPCLGQNELHRVKNSILTNWISARAPEVAEFEEKFAKYCGCKFGVATSSGTTALHLALASLNIKDGDEVIMPTLTTIICANVCKYQNAKPTMVDSESEYWQIDTSKIEEKITSKTRVIMPTHLYGHPCEMDKIMKVAKEHDLVVVEDCCEAHGATFNGKRLPIGDVGVYSFYANKIITTGEGGMIVTNNEEIAEKAKSLRDQAYGKSHKFIHDDIGFNYRMTGLQASVGLAQLERIGDFVKRRQYNACLYNHLLKDVEGLTLPKQASWARSNFWMYSILVEDEFGISRDELKQRLAEKSVETRPFFYPIHLQPPYKKFFHGEKFPVAENLSKRGLNLPSGNTLTKEQVDYVVETIKSAKQK